MTTTKMTCPACEGGDFARIVDLKAMVLDRCRQCGLVINSPQGALGAKDYYGENYDGLYENYYKNFRRRQFHDVFQRLAKLTFPGQRVLDIGCSYGWFLDAAKAHGFQAVGAEPSKIAFDRLKSDPEKVVFNCGIEGIPLIDGVFDLVTMWNVFEHLAEPMAALTQVRDKLKDDGVVLLCVPDVSGLITRLSFLAYAASFGLVNRHLLGLYQMDNDFPHLFHYSKRPLEMILRKSGFEPIASWQQDIIDGQNLGERISGYAGVKTPLKYALVAALGATQKFARLIGRQDELVVVARKV